MKPVPATSCLGTPCRLRSVPCVGLHPAGLKGFLHRDKAPCIHHHFTLMPGTAAPSREVARDACEVSRGNGKARGGGPGCLPSTTSPPPGSRATSPRTPDVRRAGVRGSGQRDVGARMPDTGRPSPERVPTGSPRLSLSEGWQRHTRGGAWARLTQEQLWWRQGLPAKRGARPDQHGEVRGRSLNEGQRRQRPARERSQEMLQDCRDRVTGWVSAGRHRAPENKHNVLLQRRAAGQWTKQESTGGLQTPIKLPLPSSNSPRRADVVGARPRAPVLGQHTQACPRLKEPALGGEYLGGRTLTGAVRSRRPATRRGERPRPLAGSRTTSWA